MNTKTVDDIIIEINARIENAILVNEEKVLLSLRDWLLEQKLLTPSPERGKEGNDDIIKFLLGEGELNGMWFGDKIKGQPFWWRKYLKEYAQSTSKPVNNETSLEKILEKWGCKIFNEVAVLDGLNLNQQDRFYNAIKEYHNMMCSKMPVEPKTRVTEDMIDDIVDGMMSEISKNHRSGWNIRKKFYLKTGLIKGLSLNQESAESIDCPHKGDGYQTTDSKGKWCYKCESYIK